MEKKVILICVGQPSTNPRIVKEAATLSERGYEVCLLYSFWVPWALPYDEKIIKENPGIEWLMVGGSPFSNKLAYAISRLRHKCYRFLNHLFPRNILFAQNAATRCFSYLLKEAVNRKADLYIAHNVGALPVVALAAKKNHAKYGFDAEDYHRGQEVNGSIEQKRTILLEEKYLPHATYITAASPLIALQYIQLFNRQVTVINNVFSIKYLVEEISQSLMPLKLFWFSQTLGKGRGIEDVIMALKDLPATHFSLTLLGNHDDETKNYFIELSKNDEQLVNINFVQPVSADEIFKIAAIHDIGLALEQPHEHNRHLCLTNKIFTYLLAGNAVLFSDTSAQRTFYEENPGVGVIYHSGNIESLQKILLHLVNTRPLLDNMKQNARKAALEKYNWEVESQKLVAIIESL